MTIDYATDHEAFEQAIIEWLRTYVTGNSNVRAAKQGAVRPSPPSATYQIIADSFDGIDSEQHEYNSTTERLDVVTSGPRRMTVQVVVYTTSGSEDAAGRSARIKLSGALSMMRNPTVKEHFNNAGLAFLQVLSPPREADEQLGDRWERRMQVDLEFGYTSLVTDKSSEGEGGLTWIEATDDIKVTYEE